MILTKMDLFATPENMKALDANIAVYNGSQRIAATVAMGVTWNFCAESTKNLSTPRAVLLSLCLSTGLAQNTSVDFNEWFAGNTMDRLNRIIDLGRELTKASWDEPDLPESYVAFEIVQGHLAHFIAQSYTHGEKLLSNEMITGKFKDLLREGQKVVIEQLTELSGQVL